MNTGLPRLGFPSVGSWVTYGLGSENENLPGFVVMSDPKGRGLPKGNSLNWTSGFLPGAYQGTWLKPTGDPIENMKRLPDVSDQDQQAALAAAARLNRLKLEESGADPELEARIKSFELAYRMQFAAPEALDLDKEPKAHPRSLRHRPPGVRPFRPAVPDRAADGRARRPLRADLFGRHGERAELGRPHRHPRQPHAVRRRDRPAGGGSAGRSGPAGPAWIRRS